jgi:sulfur-carrier protein
VARLLFFGKLGDLAGGRLREWTLSPGVETVAQLIAAIKETDPVLGAAFSETSVRFIVNEQIVPADKTIVNDDEIAFLPPVSGG